MVGSEVAHRIGCARLTRERKGLAAAAAEVELTTWAACAWLPHPSCAAEGIESWGIRPDIGERAIAHIPELEPGTRFTRMPTPPPSPRPPPSPPPPPPPPPT